MQFKICPSSEYHSALSEWVVGFKLFVVGMFSIVKEILVLMSPGPNLEEHLL